MKPSEVIVANLRGEGHIVIQVSKYNWIVKLRGTGTRLSVKGVKNLSRVWENNHS